MCCSIICNFCHLFGLLYRQTCCSTIRHKGASPSVLYTVYSSYMGTERCILLLLMDEAENQDHPSPLSCCWVKISRRVSSRLSMKRWWQSVDMRTWVRDKLLRPPTFLIYLMYVCEVHESVFCLTKTLPSWMLKREVVCYEVGDTWLKIPKLFRLGKKATENFKLCPL